MTSTQEEIFENSSKRVVEVKNKNLFNKKIVSIKRIQWNNICIWSNRNRKNIYYGR